MRVATGLTLALLLTCSANGSEFTTGPNGINSRALGLTGAGVAIGQVESGRPGMPMKNGMPFDDPMWVNSQVQPANVYAGTSEDAPNSAHVIYAPMEPEETREGLHATQVAGVMIANASTPSLQGVAPGASLYASAINGAPVGLSADQRFAMSANRIATHPADVRIINVSAGRPLENFLQETDGNQHSTQFVDWSTSEHDVLYVLGGAENVPVDVPQDNFNGITVAASDRLVAGVGSFQKVADFNTLDFDALPGVRTTIDLIAPGTDVLLTAQGNGPSIASGTSFAAPHVTGTAALLQQWADQQILAVGSPRWGDNAKQPEVMKAILLNSADKLNNVHGSTRDIFQKDGTTKWTDTLAGTEEGVSLDEQMGAGHLNAKSAFDNFKVGEYETGDVPLIGWDFGTVGFLQNNDYVFNRETSGWVAVTLAWDRYVAKSSDDPYLPTDLFDPYAPNDEVGLSTVLSNLDISLIDVSNNNVVHSSNTTVDNLEHIFFEVGPGMYKIQVSHFGGGNEDAQDYALAWWAGNITPGDFDADGDVDGADLDQWKSDFGQNGRSDANGDGVSDGSDFMIWQRNYGTGTSAVAAVGTVPEPSTWLISALGLPLLLRRRSRS